jgi:hypothetical protein
MHEIINKIVSKFGRKAVFSDVANTYVEFRLADHTYNVNAEGMAFEVIGTMDPEIVDLQKTEFSDWVTGVLAGLTRDESGSLA